MKILVTGGAGFIGSHLVDELVVRGHDVRVLDNLEEQVHCGGKPDYLNPEAEYVWGDIRDAPVLGDALDGVEAVFHEAAAVGVGQSMYQIHKYIEANTLGAARLLDLLANSEHDVRKLIVASSMSIYGEGAYRCPDCGPVHPSLREEKQLKEKQWEHQCPGCGVELEPAPTPESKPLEPTSIYAQSKRHQEEMTLLVGRTYGIPTVALRYFNVYGPRQSLSNPYTGVAAIFMSRIKNSHPPVVYEDGLQSRDFISVHDIAEANILALEKKGADYEVFNVGTGKPTTVRKVADTLIALYDSEVKLDVTETYRKGDIRHCYADVSKIREKLGFRAATSFEDGMAGLIEWSKKQEAEDRFEEASSELERRGLA